MVEYVGLRSWGFFVVPLLVAGVALGLLLGAAATSSAQDQHVLPARIQAEAFATDTDGASWNDTDGAAGNVSFEGSDGSFVPDVWTISNSAASGALIGRTRDGEYLEYMVTANDVATYDVRLAVASGDAAPGVIHVDVDGERVGTVSGDTTRWFDWTPRSAGTVTLQPGEHVVRLTWDDGANVNLDWLEFRDLAPSEPTCATGLIEAEDAEIAGRFEIVMSGDASGGAHVEVAAGTGGWWNGKSDSWVDFCFAAPGAGQYRVDALLRAPSATDNSFYVSVDDGPVVEFVADVTGNAYETDIVNERGAADRLRPAHQPAAELDPVVWDLDVGDHHVRFYLRRDGAQLDAAQLVRIGGQPAPVATPTAVPTVEPLSPGSLIVKGNGERVQILDAAGDLAAEAQAGLIRLERDNNRSFLDTTVEIELEPGLYTVLVDPPELWLGGGQAPLRRGTSDFEVRPDGGLIAEVDIGDGSRKGLSYDYDRLGGIDQPYGDILLRRGTDRETPVVGAIVEQLAAGEVVATTTTDEHGRFLFEGDARGFRVRFLPPPGLAIVGSVAGGVEAAISNANSDSWGLSRYLTRNTSVSAEGARGVFISAREVAISGCVWEDDGDGLRSDGEVGVAGLPVEVVGRTYEGLRAPVVGNIVVPLGTSITDEAGCYSVQPETRGMLSYFVRVQQAELAARGFTNAPFNQGRVEGDIESDLRDDGFTNDVDPLRVSSLNFGLVLAEVSPAPTPAPMPTPTSAPTPAPTPERAVYDLALAIELADGPLADVGDEIELKIAVANDGTVDSGTFELVVYLPPEVEVFDPAWVDNGDNTAGRLIASNLEPGDSGLIRLRLLAIAPGSPTFIFAEISSDSGDDIDSTPDAINGRFEESPLDTDSSLVAVEDDHDMARVTVAEVVEVYDLALTLELADEQPATVDVGDAIDLQVRVMNEGVVASGDYSIIAYLPDNMVLSDAGWSDNGDGTATFLPAPNLEAGNQAVVPLSLTASAGGETSVFAEILSDSGDDIDSVPDAENTDVDFEDDHDFEQVSVRGQ